MQRPCLLSFKCLSIMKYLDVRSVYMAQRYSWRKTKVDRNLSMNMDLIGRKE